MKSRSQYLKDSLGALSVPVLLLVSGWLLLQAYNLARRACRGGRISGKTAGRREPVPSDAATSDAQQHGDAALTSPERREQRRTRYNVFQLSSSLLDTHGGLATWETGMAAHHMPAATKPEGTPMQPSGDGWMNLALVLVVVYVLSSSYYNRLSFGSLFRDQGAYILNIVAHMPRFFSDVAVLCAIYAVTTFSQQWLIVKGVPPFTHRWVRLLVQTVTQLGMFVGAFVHARAHPEWPFIHRLGWLIQACVLTMKMHSYLVVNRHLAEEVALGGPGTGSLIFNLERIDEERTAAVAAITADGKRGPAGAASNGGRNGDANGGGSSIGNGVARHPDNWGSKAGKAPAATAAKEAAAAAAAAAAGGSGNWSQPHSGNGMQPHYLRHDDAGDRRSSRQVGSASGASKGAGGRRAGSPLPARRGRGRPAGPAAAPAAVSAGSSGGVGAAAAGVSRSGRAASASHYRSTNGDAVVAAAAAAPSSPILDAPHPTSNGSVAPRRSFMLRRRLAATCPRVSRALSAMASRLSRDLRSDAVTCSIDAVAASGRCSGTTMNIEKRRGNGAGSSTNGTPYPCPAAAAAAAVGRAKAYLGTVRGSPTVSSPAEGMRHAADRTREFLHDIVHGVSSEGQVTETERVAYPRNVHLTDFIMFSLYPTVCYEPSFPRTTRIRPGYVLEKLFLAAGLITCLTYIMTSYVLPLLEIVDKIDVLDAVSRLVMPSVVMMLLCWFIVFECILNGIAELTRWGDRAFYSDFWNSSTFMQFSRKWNTPIHAWLLRHVYLDSQRAFGWSADTAITVTFLVSILAHELILWGGMGVTLPYLAVASLSQFPLASIMRLPFFKNKRSGNIVFWLGIVIGVALIWVLYARELAFEPHLGGSSV